MPAGSASTKSRTKRSASTVRSSPKKNSARFTIGPTSCSANSNSHTTPKLPPPPRSAQKRSGFSSADACTTPPSAVDDLAPTRLSHDSPYSRLSQPIPPPRVRPPTPVWLITPPGGREPVLLGRRVEVGPGRAAAAARSFRRRIDGHGVHRAEVDHEPAVAATVTGVVVATAAHRDLEVVRGAAKPIAAATCSGVVHRAMTAGRRSMSPFHSERRRVVAVVGGQQQLAAERAL